MPSYEATLSVVDQLMPMGNTTMWLVFETDEPDAVVAALGRGLDKTMTQMPFLAGEIFADADDRGTAKIRWSDDDPKIAFEEVVFGGDGLSYEELEKLDFDLHKVPGSVFPLRYTETVADNVKPALIAAYTKIRGGVIALLAPHHSLVDGGGRQQIFRAWAANTGDSEPSTSTIDPKEPLDRADRLARIIKEASRNDAATSPQAPGQEPGQIHTTPPTQTVPKLFAFSAARLETLRTALRAHTQAAFSLNTMVTAVLWVTWIRAYTRNRQNRDASFDFGQEYSALVLVANTRGFLEKASLLERGSYLGNLASQVTPQPRLSLSDAARDEFFPLELGGSSSSVPCHRTIPGVIDALTAGLAGTTTAATAAAQWARLLNGDLDWSAVRARPNADGALRFTHSNWGSLDLLPDFGPGVSRPVCARIVAAGMPAGICATLPRHRDDKCGKEWLDRYDTYCMIGVDEVEHFERDELVRAMIRS
ncbi:hypothetical protein BJ166DRAFT_626865 [Pestalotiopsis sp. NC0098]|nr:hypothetical protein BJ166DRAFT_626865 [Pestalotiopsis sp. NC0098]